MLYPSAVTVFPWDWLVLLLLNCVAGGEMSQRHKVPFSTRQRLTGVFLVALPALLPVKKRPVPAEQADFQ